LKGFGEDFKTPKLFFTPDLTRVSRLERDHFHKKQTPRLLKVLGLQSHRDFLANFEL
jgi:hypothetical protein